MPAHPGDSPEPTRVRKLVARREREPGARPHPISLGPSATVRLEWSQSRRLPESASPAAGAKVSYPPGVLAGTIRHPGRYTVMRGRARPGPAAHGASITDANRPGQRLMEVQVLPRHLAGTAAEVVPMPGDALSGRRLSPSSPCMVRLQTRTALAATARAFGPDGSGPGCVLPARPSARRARARSREISRSRRRSWPAPHSDRSATTQPQSSRGPLTDQAGHPGHSPRQGG
jgi:hypothetical protein